MYTILFPKAIVSLSKVNAKCQLRASRKSICTPYGDGDGEGAAAVVLPRLEGDGKKSGMYVWRLLMGGILRTNREEQENVQQPVTSLKHKMISINPEEDNPDRESTYVT